MTESEGEPVPYLRRDPNPSTASGRKVLIGVAAFFLLLVGFVLTLVFTIGLHNNGVKLPSISSSSTPETKPPAGFFALTPASMIGTPPGSTAYVTSGSSAAVRAKHGQAVALGVAPNDLRAYSAYPLPGCRTRIEALRYLPHYRHVGLYRRTVVTVISGRVEALPMAVSPDGTKLAFVATAGHSGRTRCGGQPAVEVLDLKARRVDSGHGVRGVLSIVWAPNSENLAVVTDSGVEVFPVCATCIGIGPEAFAEVADLQSVMWWRGQLAAFVGTSLRVLKPGGLGAVLATGFPDDVLEASVAPSGQWILLTAGPITINDPGNHVSGTTYRWHDGHATKVAGEWIQPAW